MGSLTTVTPTRRDIGDELRALGWQCSTAQRRLVHLAAELEESDRWLRDGSPTAAHWIADALDVEVCTAREWIRIGHALRHLPAIVAALDDRRISYSKARELTRVATPDDELELLAIAERTTAGRLRHALATWRQARESDEETERRHRRDRYLSWRTDADGMVAGTFRLPPADAAALTASIDTRVMRSTTVGGHHAPAGASSGTRSDAWPSLGQQRADALSALVRDAAREGDGDGLVTEVVLHVRGDGCTLDDGTPVPGSVVERIAPEAFISVLIHDAEGRPLNASGRQRHPTRRQRRVVRERDRGCVDCGSTDLLEFDHVPDFAATGRTLVDELRQRCAPCHHRRHATDGPSTGGPPFDG